MRATTDARRDVITGKAWEAFRENGFERTTMSEIAQRLGASKGTLYNYFKSKEDLFATALQQAMAARWDEAFEHLTPTGQFGERLLGFARAYLKARLTPDMVSAERAIMTEGDRSDLGEVMRAQFNVPHWRRFAAVLEQEMSAGRLRGSEPYTAAQHFRGLIEADIIERRMHGDRTLTDQQIEAAIRDGVEAFLRAYEP